MMLSNDFVIFPYISNAEKLERWRNCERVLVNMPEHERNRHWDMADWGYENDCGTIACAAGHCGLDPWFKERGFRFGEIYSTKVGRFFGQEGTSRIFCNGTQRPVEAVIEEVREQIRYLGRQIAMSRAA